MWKRIGLALASLLLAGAVYTAFDYARDPLYWQRWWDLVSNTGPEHMNFHPTEAVQSSRTYLPPLAAARGLTISAEALDRAVEYAKSMDSFALLVLHQGVLQREWYAEGWKPSRLTQSQSMHKTVAAMLVGQAIADGHIGGLDDRIGLYLPEWSGDERGDITLRQLLEMSSGLAQYRFTLNPYAADSSFRFLNASDRASVVLATPLAWPPGSRFDYNDINAQLAGMIVENASGMRYSEYLMQRLWEPMGGRYAEVWLDSEDGLAMSACCLLATPRDWAIIGLLFQNGGRVNGRQVMDPAWLDAMTQPSANYAGYGLFTWLGPGIADRDDGGNTEIQQAEPFVAGDLLMLLGYGGQRVFVSRDLELVIVRLGPFAGMQPLSPAWDNAALPNIIARGIRGQ